MPQKYSKFLLFFQVQRPLQTFAKPLRCFTTHCSSRLQHFIYRSPTYSSLHLALSTASSARRKLLSCLPLWCPLRLSLVRLKASCPLRVSSDGIPWHPASSRAAKATTVATRILDEGEFFMAYLITVMRSVCETPFASIIRNR